ncbi:metal ABC transporter ATP-binding protein [Angustibacter sp. McL0619]|uniref:metal ABC transporter ATP-binding protein n=1 Tax=Angustibacter sp. McL0619 TaxID=3415676 RepID=UPI003CF8A219
MTSTPVVRMRDVTIGYGDRPVVRDADLTVTDGEVVAVLGANGSGKTTLVRGLLGLATVMRGEVELLGKPLRTRRDRAAIGYVPQRHTVGGAIASTVREVVSSGRLPRLGLFGRLGAVDRAVVTEAIDAVRLGGFADTNIAELSGGQQRRVLIARALAAEPGVLVMDEPTAGVDQVSQQALADTIRQLATRGVPMIIVTHEVGPLADTLTRAVVVSDGRITYDGPPPSPVPHAPHSADHHHLPDPHADDPRHPSAWIEHPLGGA